VPWRRGGIWSPAWAGTSSGIPTRLLNAPSIDAETYSNAQEANIDLLHYTLENYINAIEEAITDLLPATRNDHDHFAADRGHAAGGGISIPVGRWPTWMTIPEVREAEGQPPQEMAANLAGRRLAAALVPANAGPSTAQIGATTGRLNP
jgi:hypothetical protein